MHAGRKPAQVLSFPSTRIDDAALRAECRREIMRVPPARLDEVLDYLREVAASSLRNSSASS